MGRTTTTTASDLDSDVTIIEKWIESQYHLPQSIDKLLLKRFIYSSFGDLEKTKKLIELNYALRNNYPQIFLNRDPCDVGSQQLFKVADLLPLPGLTKERNKILFYRLLDYDADKFQFTEGVKVFFMLADCRFVTIDPAGLSDGEIPIFDMAGFSLRHLTKVVFSSLRIYMKFVQEAHPVRLKEIHVINCPSYLDKVLMVIKPFIKSEVFKLIKFHLPNSDTLYKHISRDMLPDEYGGKAGKIADLKNEWVEIMTKNRDYLTNPKLWKTNDMKKSSKKVAAQNSIESFQNLSID